MCNAANPVHTLGISGAAPQLQRLVRIVWAQHEDLPLLLVMLLWLLRCCLG